MADHKNVGNLDSFIRIILGLTCVALVIYNFAIDKIVSIYGIIPLLILIPFFLKIGVTQVCPIMKSLKISTRK